MPDLLDSGRGYGQDNVMTQIRELQREVRTLRSMVEEKNAQYDLAFEIVWTVTSLTTRYSELYPAPFDAVLYEVVFYLATESTATGPTLRSYIDGTQITTNSFAAGESAARSAGLSTHFAAGQSFFQFRIFSLGDGTASGLTCVARFR